MSKTVQPSDIPEVRDFLTADRAIEVFKEDNKQVFDEYSKLVEDRNTKFQAADKIVRGQDVSCGPWDRYQVAVSYNADALHAAVGKKLFLEVGGTITTQTIYEVDKARLELAISKKAIPPELVKDIKSIQPRYHTPKKL